ncbi:MAG: SRPBCC domain-containing protein [Rhizobiaceae bacterium]|nr:SRPBCC domain-containing protein [Rhizobiaceae bacterium]
MSDLTLTTSRHIKAARNIVFDAWLDPEMLARFMLPGEGMTVPSASVEPQVGGRFAIVMQAGDQQIPHGGEYKEIDRFDRIIFTWESPFSVDGSTVTLNFKDADSGGTDLELIHVKFADEPTRDNHLGGWDSILATLDGVLS